ncbi:MAG: hypothetical protein Tsb0014_14760 [Pleurocapsa sp.]
MGKKAKRKKMRQQGQDTEKNHKQYEPTQFVRQFEKMGYQLQPNSGLRQPSRKGLPKVSQSEINQNNFPEIPQDRIEPQI